MKYFHMDIPKNMEEDLDKILMGQLMIGRKYVKNVKIILKVRKKH